MMISMKIEICILWWKIKLGKITLAYQCRWMYTDSRDRVQKEERASERERSCNDMESLLDYWNVDDEWVIREVKCEQLKEERKICIFIAWRWVECKSALDYCNFACYRKHFNFVITMLWHRECGSKIHIMHWNCWFFCCHIFSLHQIYCSIFFSILLNTIPLFFIIETFSMTNKYYGNLWGGQNEL